jgi:hypothetical protein
MHVLHELYALAHMGMRAAPSAARKAIENQCRCRKKGSPAEGMYRRL